MVVERLRQEAITSPVCPPFLEEAFRALALEPPTGSVLERARQAALALQLWGVRPEVSRTAETPGQLLAILPQAVAPVANHIDSAYLFPQLVPFVSHGPAHLEAVDQIGRRILELLALPQGDPRVCLLVDCFRVATYLHDLGNWGGRKNHDQAGALAAWDWLSNCTGPGEDVRRIITYAVASHNKSPRPLLDQNTVREGVFSLCQDGPLGHAGQDVTSEYYLVAALLYLADKLQVGRTIPEDLLMMQRLATAQGEGRSVHLAQANFEGLPEIHLTDDDFIVVLSTDLLEYFREAAAGFFQYNHPLSEVFGELLPWLSSGSEDLLPEKFDDLIRQWVHSGDFQVSGANNLLATLGKMTVRHKLLALTSFFPDFNAMITQELREAYGRNWTICAHLLQGMRGRPTRLIVQTDWPSRESLIFSSPILRKHR
jgi:hypothetical protein